MVNKSYKINNIAAAKDLYLSCFNDTLLNTNFLFDNFLNNSYHFFIEKENQIISQLFLVPCKIKNINGYYLYAASTNKNYRNLGYMNLLLNSAKEFANNSFIITKPANEGLFNFYIKNGFNNTIFCEDKDYTVNTSLIQIDLKKTTAKEYFNIKKDILNKNNINFLNFNVTYFKTFDYFYDFYINLNTFIAVDKEYSHNQKIKICEFYGPNTAINSLLLKLNKKSAKILLPGNKKPNALIYTNNSFIKSNPPFNFLYFE